MIDVVTIHMASVGEHYIKINFFESSEYNYERCKITNLEKSRKL